MSTWQEVCWENDGPDAGELIERGIDPATARFDLVDMPLDRVAGKFGTWESYAAEEPERMAAMLADVDDLPPAIFILDDGHYHHVDGAHRFLTHRHLGRSTMPAFVCVAGSGREQSR